MSEEGNIDATRKTVKTFVPAYQKSEWKRHADELDMSQSEFVRTMVQAGRRDFDIEAGGDSSPDSSSGSDADVSDASDAGDATESEDLAEHVLAVLSASDHLSWEELVDELTNNIEDRLEETLQRLQTENRVQYSGRHGGYTLVGTDGD